MDPFHEYDDGIAEKRHKFHAQFEGKEPQLDSDLAKYSNELDNKDHCLNIQQSLIDVEEADFFAQQNPDLNESIESLSSSNYDRKQKRSYKNKRAADKLKFRKDNDTLINYKIKSLEAEITELRKNKPVKKSEEKNDHFYEKPRGSKKTTLNRKSPTEYNNEPLGQKSRNNKRQLIFHQSIDLTDDSHYPMPSKITRNCQKETVIENFEFMQEQIKHRTSIKSRQSQIKELESEKFFTKPMETYIKNNPRLLEADLRRTTIKNSENGFDKDYYPHGYKTEKVLGGTPTFLSVDVVSRSEQFLSEFKEMKPENEFKMQEIKDIYQAEPETLAESLLDQTRRNLEMVKQRIRKKAAYVVGYRRFQLENNWVEPEGVFNKYQTENPDRPVFSTNSMYKLTRWCRYFDREVRPLDGRPIGQTIKQPTEKDCLNNEAAIEDLLKIASERKIKVKNEVEKGEDNKKTIDLTKKKEDEKTPYFNFHNTIAQFSSEFKNCYVCKTSQDVVDCEGIAFCQDCLYRKEHFLRGYTLECCKCEKKLMNVGEFAFWSRKSYCKRCLAVEMRDNGLAKHF